MNQPSFVSLFSGCGGFDLGFVSNGFRSLAAFDNWPLATEVYNANVGPHAMVKDLSVGGLPDNMKCDLVIAGSPCQGFSQIGKRNISDPRNNLFLQAGVLATRLKPKVIVFENVPGILMGQHKQYFDSVIGHLCIEGYAYSYATFNVSDFGVPQTRKRVLLIAWKKKLIDRVSIPNKTSPRLGDVLKGVRSLSNHEPKVLKEGTLDSRIAAGIRQGQKLSDVRAGPSTVHSWDLPAVFGQTTELEKSILNVTMKLRRRERERDFGDADPVGPDRISEELGQNVSGQIDQLIKKNYLRRIGERVDLKRAFNGKFRRAAVSELSCTVDTRFGEPRNFLHPTENRGFSVREAARIQGFPDTFKFSGTVQDQFRLVGNAVPPALGASVASAIRTTFFQ